MRLVWNKQERSFEAEFQDFKGDLEAVKAAGFKTSGPPSWVWYATKASQLDKLKEKRPASLTILEDALLEYQKLKKEEDEKAALLNELKAAKKAVKTALADQPEEQSLSSKEWFEYVNTIESSGSEKVEHIWDGPICSVCNCPVYFYMTQTPPMCLWCEKQLDSEPELF